MFNKWLLLLFLFSKVTKPARDRMETRAQGCWLRRVPCSSCLNKSPLFLLPLLLSLVLHPWNLGSEVRSGGAACCKTSLPLLLLSSDFCSDACRGGHRGAAAGETGGWPRMGWEGERGPLEVPWNQNNWMWGYEVSALRIPTNGLLASRVNPGSPILCVRAPVNMLIHLFISHLWSTHTLGLALGCYLIFFPRAWWVFNLLLKRNIKLYH